MLLLTFWLSEKYLLISSTVAFSGGDSCGCNNCGCGYWSLLNKILEIGYTGSFVSLSWL
jgi:hypothetical protein